MTAGIIPANSTVFPAIPGRKNYKNNTIKFINVINLSRCFYIY